MEWGCLQNKHPHRHVVQESHASDRQELTAGSLRGERYPARISPVESVEPLYARTADGTHIAYAVLGDGPIDLVYAFGYESNIDADGDVPFHAAFRERLASFSRLILFDRRGTGLSDRSDLGDVRSLEAGMDDIGAVLDAVGSERALLFGSLDGSLIAALFAASHPERTLGLVLWNPEPRQSWAEDYPWGWRDEQWAERIEELDRTYGTMESAKADLAVLAPGIEFDHRTLELVARMFRAAASPGSAVQIERTMRGADVRSILPTVQVPTLVLHSSDDSTTAQARYTASMIPGAKVLQIPYPDLLPLWRSAETVAGEIRRFGEAIRDEEAVLNRTLATVMFTDIVDSTAKAFELGDRKWKELLERHHSVVRMMLRRYRGVEVNTAGDGFFATFDGPARGVKCAVAIAEAMRSLGLEIRAGIHTGEVETIDRNVGGLGVVIGARVGALAVAGEVLVSSTVRDLVVGSDLNFEDAGEHDLKGVPNRWHLYRVANGSP